MSQVIVYTMSNCPYCVKAKKLLESRQVKFKEVDTDPISDQEWKDLCGKSGMKTLPQIFNGETVIGGFTELAEMDSADKLASLKN